MLSFIELLAAPSSTIASHVRNLYVDTENDNSVSIFDIVAPYFNKFVAVKTFTLDGAGRRLVTIDEALSREFGRIGSMDLAIFLYNFYRETFRLTFMLGDSGPLTLSSHLHILRSVLEDEKKPLPCHPLPAQLPAACEVFLHHIQESQLPTAQAVLKSCTGQTVHTINLSVASDPISIGNYLDLSNFTNLRSLTIRIQSIVKIERTVADESFSKILQSISSLCMTHIQLETMADLTGLVWVDWKKVADELSHPRFTELQEVCVKIMTIGVEKDEAIALIRREMSSLHDQNILTVTTY